MEVKSVLTRCMKRGSVNCFVFVLCIGGGRTSGTVALWSQILLDGDYLDQEKPVETV